ncbi:DUF3489 domain-containing protein [Psychromarinibacter sp. C21-152]|uniref:DUF3489 domain-containing protein n=1 Tax=Psychromarinibacter sediminicola TaxID=3033385 RepID=A0AAE3NXU2_9RHOB|nr:DUF3489 domain-containing protein [Psychromarinibacter sediminicola]MDF0603961.1 DUF3489 domain-containing protein [Psychromarinibacter sediminicola]
MTTQSKATETSDAPSASRSKAAASSKRPARTTKKAQLIRMLSRKDGVDVATISTKLGWQQHTTRAALTGLRKGGYEITAENHGDGRASRYRIEAHPASDAD